MRSQAKGQYPWPSELQSFVPALFGGDRRREIIQQKQREMDKKLSLASRSAVVTTRKKLHLRDFSNYKGFQGYKISRVPRDGASRTQQASFLGKLGGKGGAMNVSYMDYNPIDAKGRPGLDWSGMDVSMMDGGQQSLLGLSAINGPSMHLRAGGRKQFFNPELNDFLNTTRRHPEGGKKSGRRRGSLVSGAYNVLGGGPRVNRHIGGHRRS
jgi:hypothetical protein